MDTLGASPSCIPIQTRLITTDAGTESGRTFPCIFFQNPAALSSSNSGAFPSALHGTSIKLFTTFPSMIRTQVIVHPYDMAQSDWVRCILPCTQFMGPNDFQVVPSITQIVCANKDALKQGYNDANMFKGGQ